MNQFCVPDQSGLKQQHQHPVGTEKLGYERENHPHSISFSTTTIQVVRSVTDSFSNPLQL